MLGLRLRRGDFADSVPSSGLSVVSVRLPKRVKGEWFKLFAEFQFRAAS